MEKGILLIPLMPVRLENSDSSEMVTQVLFGECFQIHEETDKWAFIRLERDNYEGWADKKMIHKLSPQLYEELKNTNTEIISSVVTKVYSEKSFAELWLPAGSEIYKYNIDGNSFNIAGEKFIFKEVPEISPKKSRESIVNSAAKFLNAPYLWGGKSFMGIDCSGLTQLIMKIHGINIPRDAKYQVETGKTLSFIEEAKPGDLAYFDDEKGDITHVGIITDNQTIIHASGKVRKDRFDQQGIFSMEMNRYTHKLRIIKSLL
jgi:gamma-D-glutamyl-L-lysine dipeptidyl-peptidase